MRPNDPLLADQWYLFNPNQLQNVTSPDIISTWNRTQGEGVVIGFVDDGVDYNHPDLRANYRADLSYDFWGQDFDPSPTDGSNHGTMIAGIAIATSNNGIGVSGVAPRAGWAMLRHSSFIDAEVALTLSHRNQKIDIYSNSWGPHDDGKTLQGPGRLTLEALRQGVIQGRGGRGNIYVWAGGNGGTRNDNVNYDGYANSRYTIAVAAVDRNGDRASYSEPGAPILVSAYSNGGGSGIRTTDLQGAAGESVNDYTYAGLSSATVPFVSGSVALMLSANPGLTWRDVQHILVNTSIRTDPTDPDWVFNGAGLAVNHQYGFGRVDVGAAVSAAESWQSVGAEQNITSGLRSVNRAIPDNNLAGLEDIATVNRAIAVEWAEVVFDATHGYRGDLQVELISPSGTRSRLAETREDDNDNYSRWTFTSARHWGESSQGTWRLQVTDRSTGDVGIWNSWQLNLFGAEQGSNLDNGGDIVGTNRADWPLLGSGRSENIRGLQGNDRLEGLGGNDVLWGESGDDKLFGGAGNDTLYATDWETRGRGEIDHMTGGTGRDRFILGDAGGSYYISKAWGDFVIINDFDARADRVELYGSASDYRLEVRGRQTRLRYWGGADPLSGDVVAVFEGQTNLTLFSNAFQFV